MHHRFLVGVDKANVRGFDLGFDKEIVIEGDDAHDFSAGLYDPVFGGDTDLFDDAFHRRANGGSIKSILGCD
jgi:hypothetical protein